MGGHWVMFRGVAMIIWPMTNRRNSNQKLESSDTSHNILKLIIADTQ